MKLVREVNEDPAPLVLDDPDALAVMQAVEKHNCRILFGDNADRIAHFKGRLAAKGLSDKEYCIVLLNVDDVHGGPIADVLMPGFDWQAVRDQGQVPIARGLADRLWLQEVVSTFDDLASAKLRDLEGTVVLVVDRGVAEVFPA